MPIAKPKPKGKAKGGLRRGEAYSLLKSLGGRFAADTTPGLNLGTFTFPTHQRLNFLDRALDSEAQTLAKNDLFGWRYRSSWGEQDELFSTASTRFFVQGLLNSLPRGQIADDVWQRWTTFRPFRPAVLAGGCRTWLNLLSRSEAQGTSL
ncbi:hypothetical protein FPZ54_10760 [Sphingomonas suaedae]|uniref:Uncharacterized protein n=1 Tax=Sphingomonas suaedae TaxID=2599297 RepID=A0A518RG80_9SPHN|nr:hypothetical protein FPZ54_10760 [Sphingomonas suaedae]